MIFFVYASTNNESIKGSMGAADYSYFFVLKSYIPVLEKLGTVIQINKPATELADWYSAAKLMKKSCVFLQFLPPHKIYADTLCPSVCVFAWEYTTIPTESWGGSKWNDWRCALTQQGGAITHSTMASNSITDAMGSRFNTIDVAAPVWDNYQSEAPADPSVTLDYQGLLFDSSIAGLDHGYKNEEQCQSYVSEVKEQSVELSGVIYSSVFCPIDGRKNWPDLVSSFCYAFREQRDVTLVLKLIHFDDIQAIKETLPTLCKNAPFKCRIVVIAGFLSSKAYRSLINISSFIVNSSYGEGQCLPLMEFMSSGVPAIAPNHSAMADYMSDKTGFVVESSLEWTHWPHDPRILLKTMRYRLNWESMRDAYSKSYKLISTDRPSYMSMQASAKASLNTYCSQATATEKLTSFFQRFTEDGFLDNSLVSLSKIEVFKFQLCHFLIKLVSTKRWVALKSKELW
ncbi:MAG: glycosyltransferase involved in cell wall biosynthesis [Oceanospirillaceae bacterium]